MNFKKWKLILILFFFLFLDQLSKFLIRINLFVGQSVPIIDNVLHFTYLHNSGATWGILKGNNILFIIASGIVLVLIYNRREFKKFEFSYSLIIAGIIGNLIDRIFLGGVTDFIDFRIWPVFNIADSCITIGVIILIYSILRKERTSPL